MLHAGPRRNGVDVFSARVTDIAEWPDIGKLPDVTIFFPLAPRFCKPVVGIPHSFSPSLKTGVAPCREMEMILANNGLRGTALTLLPAIHFPGSASSPHSIAIIGRDSRSHNSRITDYDASFQVGYCIMSQDTDFKDPRKHIRDSSCHQSRNVKLLNGKTIFFPAMLLLIDDAIKVSQ